MQVIVNRDLGWPVLNPTAKLFEVIDLPEEDAESGIAAGYLKPVIEVVNGDGETAEIWDGKPSRITKLAESLEEIPEGKTFSTEGVSDSEVAEAGKIASAKKK